jgi:hypothetical protein
VSLQGFTTVLFTSGAYLLFVNETLFMKMSSMDVTTLEKRSNDVLQVQEQRDVWRSAKLQTA